MNFTISHAGPKDAKAVTQILNDIIRNTLVTFSTVEKSEDEIRQTIAAKQSYFLVAKSADQVLGFATYGDFRNGAGYKHTQELTIHLTPAARGQGIGRALLQKLEQIAQDNDVHVLVSGISGANTMAVAFHKAMGFEEVGLMPQAGRKWGQWLDLVLMQKIL